VSFAWNSCQVSKSSESQTSSKYKLLFFLCLPVIWSLQTPNRLLNDSSLSLWPNKMWFFAFLFHVWSDKKSTSFLCMRDSERVNVQTGFRFGVFKEHMLREANKVNGVCRKLRERIVCGDGKARACMWKSREHYSMTSTHPQLTPHRNTCMTHQCRLTILIPFETILSFLFPFPSVFLHFEIVWIFLCDTWFETSAFSPPSGLSTDCSRCWPIG